MDLSELGIDSKWALFLDRDGVVNRKLENAYVRDWDEYEFLPGVLNALRTLAGIFGRTIIVTNQQGIGKGLMTEADLASLHNQMIAAISESGGRVDAIYHCPHLAADNCACRKPKTGMVKRALKDFPDIDPGLSIMVGDSEHDMVFGKRAGMITVGVGHNTGDESMNTDVHVAGLAALAQILKGSASR